VGGVGRPPRRARGLGGGRTPKPRQRMRGFGSLTVVTLPGCGQGSGRLWGGQSPAVSCLLETPSGPVACGSASRTVGRGHASHQPESQRAEGWLGVHRRSGLRRSHRALLRVSSRSCHEPARSWQRPGRPRNHRLRNAEAPTLGEDRGFGCLRFCCGRNHRPGFSGRSVES
jgi:hypothetical protein